MLHCSSFISKFHDSLSWSIFITFYISVLIIVTILFWISCRTPSVEPLFSRVTGRNHLSFPDLCPNRPCHEKKKTKVIRRILKEREKTQRLLAVELEKSYQSTATGNSIITLGKMERDAGEKRESLKRLERQKYEKRRQQQQQRQQQI